jgi:hypothetical protein
MSVNIIISSQKYFNEFKNDIGFVSNLGDFTNNLTGSIMENVKIFQQINVSWDSFSSQSNPFEKDSVIGTVLGISRVAGSWITDGFAVGDSVDFTYNSATILTVNPGVVTAISPLIIYVDFGVVIPPRDNAFDNKLYGKTPLTALIFNFGLIGNSENFNTISKVSGNNQGYYGSNIGFDIGGGVRDLNWVNLIKLGSYQDWQTGSVRVRYINNPSTYVQRYEIEQEATIVPYYLEGELGNLQNNILPNLYNGLNTLKYVYSAGFRTVLSNPNTQKNFKIDNNLGSIAWFNENFNGFQNNYNVKSITYEDAVTTDSADGILIGTKSRIIITVENLITPYVGGDRFGVYVSYLPTKDEYQNTTLSNLKQNFIYDRAINNEGIAPTLGDDFITKCEAIVVGGDLEITIELEYSSIQKSYLSSKLATSGANYLIAIEVGDITLSSGNSDRVLLLADAKEYDQSADIPDLMIINKFDMFPHNKQIGVDVGYTDLIVWNEDGFVVDFDFSLDLNKSAFINSLEFKLIAFNSITLQMFEIDTYIFNNIGSAIVSGGVQQLFENTTRGYNLENADQFNDVIISVDSNILGIQHYVGRFAQKINWQDWISNLDVDNIFFDNSKPNQNKNKKSSNYSLLNNYEIRLAVFSNLNGVSVLGVGGNTNYLFQSPNIIVYDYELDGNIMPIWTQTIETFHPTTLVNLQGKLLIGLNTILKTTWVNSGGPVVSIVAMWAIHRIEETNQPGNQIDELSTINPYPSNNRLIPLVGETQLKIYIDTGNVITECLVDGSKILPGVSYNLSARINEEAVIPLDAKITEESVVKITEAADIKIIE